MLPRTTLLLSFFLAGSFCLRTQPEVGAQVSVGAHGSITEINRTAWGLGGRVGSVIHRTTDLTFGLEGVGEYLWPSCEVVECSAYALQANLMARRGVASFADIYGGLGFVYESYTLQSNGRKLKGDDVGLNMLLGTQSGTPGAVRPFLEVRFTVMADLHNQAGVSAGLRFPVGG